LAVKGGLRRRPPGCVPDLAPRIHLNPTRIVIDRIDIGRRLGKRQCIDAFRMTADHVEAVGFQLPGGCVQPP